MRCAYFSNALPLKQGWESGKEVNLLNKVLLIYLSSVLPILFVIPVVLLYLTVRTVEPVLDKVQSRKPEENSRNHGTADVFFSPGWQSSQSSTHAIVSLLWLTKQTQPGGSSKSASF